MDPLELREICDPNDQIDRFVFMLAETVADLSAMETTFKQTLDDDSVPPSRRWYLQRQYATRVYESWRVVAAIRDNENITQFIDEAGATDEADWLLERFTRKTPIEKTEIERTFGAQRHRAVHLAGLDSDLLKETLEQAADSPAQIAQDNENKTGTIEFPEEAISRVSIGEGPFDEEKFLAALAERAKLIDESARRFGVLWRRVLVAQVERKGIDPDRLYVDRVP